MSSTWAGISVAIAVTGAGMSAAGLAWSLKDPLSERASKMSRLHAGGMAITMAALCILIQSLWPRAPAWFPVTGMALTWWFMLHAVLWVLDEEPSSRHRRFRHPVRHPEGA